MLWLAPLAPVFSRVSRDAVERLLDGTGGSGLALDVKTDALWVGTKSEDTSELAPTEGDVTRLRVTLAGERAFAAGDGARLTPSAEVGVRHDGGDAESGTGLEVGAGLSYVAGALPGKAPHVSSSMLGPVHGANAYMTRAL